jgi:hypothetical protein
MSCFKTCGDVGEGDGDGDDCDREDDDGVNCVQHLLYRALHDAFESAPRYHVDLAHVSRLRNAHLMVMVMVMVMVIIGAGKTPTRGIMKLIMGSFASACTCEQCQKPQRRARATYQPRHLHLHVLRLAAAAFGSANETPSRPCALILIPNLVLKSAARPSFRKILWT